MKSTRRPRLATTAARLIGGITGFSVLLFVARFLLRGHLIPLIDQECHIGGIAVDVLAHGVRFPLMVYAPNEYDNGSFLSGLLTTVSFSLLGRNVLALKLVTHVISAIAAVAALGLLRDCLDELRLTAPIARRVATAALVIMLAFAPRLVTIASMYAVGNHAEGAAIDVILLALFSRSLHSPTRSAIHVAALWALVGVAVYVNKGTLLVLPVLAASEIAFASPARRSIPAAAGGFLVGILPELFVIAQRHAMGWAVMAGKVERNAHGFPGDFYDSIGTLADHRPELLVSWALGLAFGLVTFVRSAFGGGRSDPDTATRLGSPAPIALGMLIGVACLHVLALTAMAQGGLDAYAIYSYPALVILFALALGSVCAGVATRWSGQLAASSVVVAAIALTLILYRPDRLTWGTATVSALWRNRAGAACSWRFAEGFEREHEYGLAPPAETREQHAIDRCRSLTDEDQILDCIGGIARELNWRENGKVPGEPPSTLTPDERRAFAYLYGTHRRGNSMPCREFRHADLVDTCASATQLECLVFGDVLTRFASGHPIGRPRCAIREPPMGGYWATMRSELLARDLGPPPEHVQTSSVDAELEGCGPVFDACY